MQRLLIADVADPATATTAAKTASIVTDMMIWLQPQVQPQPSHSATATIMVPDYVQATVAVPVAWLWL
jgi:hypothetical protein